MKMNKCMTCGKDTIAYGNCLSCHMHRSQKTGLEKIEKDEAKAKELNIPYALSKEQMVQFINDKVPKFVYDGKIVTREHVEPQYAYALKEPEEVE